jgi:hypothetical protein
MLTGTSLDDCEIQKIQPDQSISSPAPVQGKRTAERGARIVERTLFQVDSSDIVFVRSDSTIVAAQSADGSSSPVRCKCSHDIAPILLDVCNQPDDIAKGAVVACGSSESFAFSEKDNRAVELAHSIVSCANRRQDWSDGGGMMKAFG